MIDRKFLINLYKTLKFEQKKIMRNRNSRSAKEGGATFKS